MFLIQVHNSRIKVKKCTGLWLRTHFSGCGFQNLCQPPATWYEILSISCRPKVCLFSYRIAISSHSIPPKISGFADRVRAKISQEVEDKMVSVQVDGCSKKHRRFIGIRIQHINDKKMVVRTLAVEELFLPSTAANLKAVIMRVLRKYGIPLKSVVSFTTDTGQNYVLAGKLLNLGDDESSDDDDDGVFNFPADLELTQDNISIQSVRCAAHTLQLAVEDAKNLTTEMKPTIDAVRKLVLFLRNEKQVRQIKENNQNMPSLDVCTRWGSTYDMLQSLQMLRNFLDFNLDWTPKDRAENNLSDDQWDEVDSIIEDLQPARRATTKLQVESLTLGEFFGIWQELVMTLEKAATPFAKKLVDAMDKRAKAQQYRQRNRGEKLPPLFNYPAFNASVFLDPRYFSLLDGEEVKEAKTYLLELWERLQRVKGPQISPEDVHVEDDDASSGAESSSGDEYDFAKFLAARNKERIALTSTSCRPGGTPTQHAAAAKLKKSLDEYDNTERPLGVKEDVFKWWEDKRLLYPELYELSKIVLAISATQVSVERLFSALRYILRPQRFGLQAANIDDVVLMHTNADLVEELARELLTEEKEDKDKGAIRDQSGSSLTCTFPSRSSSL